MLSRKVYFVLGVIVLLLLWFFCCCGNCKSMKAAVVDVQRIVNQARPVTVLREELQTQMAALQEWVASTTEVINKETSKEKKDELTKQYQEELTKKQQVIQREYAEKLQKIDADLTALIEKVAKKEGYGITFVKGSVAAGGVDITDKVLAALPK